MKNTITGAMVVLGLCGCAVNGFEKFYMPLPGSETIHSQPWIEPATGEPEVYAYSNNPQADVLRAEEEGYLQIGTAAFYGPPATMTKAELFAQAERLGAALVLIHSQYKDTISGVVPWSVPNPPQVSTVSSNGTVSSYGSGGYATGTYSGESTITTPGGTTTYAIPYSISRNDMVATFWVRQDVSKVRLGAYVQELPDALREKLQRNTGVVVAFVVRDTPAFDANILRDDVILKIGGEDVIDPQGFKSQVAELQGQTVKIELLRRDTPKVVTVTLRTPS